jgi:glycine betaine/proline transport system permease protein
VPVGLSEAAIMLGCTPLQRLRLVLLPAALPELLLGLNQAVMLGFSMLVITALVGTRGLEETTLVAVSKVRPGDGLVAGFGIAALAIIVDRLIGIASGAAEKKYRPAGGAGH